MQVTPYLFLNGNCEAALSFYRRVFDALAAGGSVTVPFEKTFWTEGFGMLTDRFGVPWMVNCEH